ncbi:unnamed protein product [Thelazia callipaeda]|uniref:RNA 3'-terminal phosphate cyclase domain-containing protein n=1 Tax=Thelazia callipaeda TaxID=103827 RepID=A0A3P7KR23_THECL|nr:unnamed protein product [Thelazia callipaeda]
MRILTVGWESFSSLSSEYPQRAELHFSGCSFFRQRLVYSLLSGRLVIIRDIRKHENEPGIREFEVKLLVLLEKVTNGTRIRINETGTEVLFSPGMVMGGSLDFDCGTDRFFSWFRKQKMSHLITSFSSYYVEPLLMLAPFCKYPLKVELRGVTNSPGELSIDAIRATWLPVFNKFVRAFESPEIKIVARGYKPDGGGCVLFTAPITRTLRPVQSMGKVCKIRGIALIAKVSPSIAHRMIDAAKKALRNYVADVYITIDQRKGAAGGSSPGFGLFLTAETTEGIVYHGNALSKPKGEQGNQALPEDVGHGAACQLLDQIYAGGCVDITAQALAVTFMALCEKDVSTYLFGPLSVCWFLLKSFFEIKFKIEEWNKQCVDNKQRLGSNEKALLTCIGIGYSNLNKTVL